MSIILLYLKGKKISDITLLKKVQLDNIQQLSKLDELSSELMTIMNGYNGIIDQLSLKFLYFNHIVEQHSKQN